MKITLNSQPLELDKPLNVAELLNQNGYADKIVAVARNGEFIPRSTYGDVQTEDGDEFDIVAPMQGG